MSWFLNLIGANTEDQSDTSKLRDVSDGNYQVVHGPRAFPQRGPCPDPSPVQPSRQSAGGYPLGSQPIAATPIQRLAAVPLIKDEEPMSRELGLRAIPWIGKGNGSDMNWMYPMSVYRPDADKLGYRLPENVANALVSVVMKYPDIKAEVLVINHAASQFKAEWMENPSKRMVFRYAIHPCMYCDQKFKTGESRIFWTSLFTLHGREETYSVTNGLPINEKVLVEPACFRRAEIMKSSDECTMKFDSIVNYVHVTADFAVDFSTPITSFFVCCLIAEGPGDNPKADRVVITLHTIISDQELVLTRHLSPLTCSAKVEQMLEERGKAREEGMDREVAILYTTSLKLYYERIIQNIENVFKARMSAHLCDTRDGSTIVETAIRDIGKALFSHHSGRPPYKSDLASFRNNFDEAKWMKCDFRRGISEILKSEMLPKDYSLLLLKRYMQELCRPFAETRDWQRKVLEEYEAIGFCNIEEDKKEHILYQPEIKEKYKKVQNAKFPHAECDIDDTALRSDIKQLRKHKRHLEGITQKFCKIPERLEFLIYYFTTLIKPPPWDAPPYYAATSYWAGHKDQDNPKWWIDHKDRSKMLADLLSDLEALRSKAYPDIV